jgi:AcrR family transcriptional regulator
MYHFPTKEALLTALVTQAVTDVDQALATAMSANSTAGNKEPGAFTRAYLEITVPGTPEDPDGGTSPVAALAAAIALDPTLLLPLREAYNRWQYQLEHDGLDVAAATAVRMAVDGWWLAALLGLPRLDPEVHLRTRQLLKDLTRQPTD